MAVLAFAAVASAQGITSTVALAAISAAGSLIDSALLFPAVFGKSQNVEGTRLDDLSVTAASEGSPSRLCLGPEVRTGGAVIWSTDLIETTRTETVGGKGGNGARTTSYAYSISQAVRLCETDALVGGKISKVRKVWANGKLVYDYDAGPTEADRVDNRYAEIRFYLGDQTSPDPLIEAAIGVGDTPPFKGSAYFVVEDLKLEDFGNRSPNWEALVEVSETQAVGDAIRIIITNAGLNDSDIDVSGVTADLTGLLVVGEQEAAKVCEVLMQAYNVTLSEQNGVLVFADRSQVPQVVVGAGSLGAAEFGQDAGARPYPLLREGFNDRSLPKRVVTTFADSDCGWEQASRTAVKTNTTNQAQIRVDLPLTLTQEQGSEIALRTLWTQWGVRERVSFDLPPSLIALTAGDLVQVPDGDAFDLVRLQQITRGRNYLCECTGFVEEPEIYDQNAISNDRSCVPADAPYSNDGDLAFMVITDHHVGDPGEQSGESGDRLASDNVCFWAWSFVGEIDGNWGGVLYDSASAAGQYYRASGFTEVLPARMGKIVTSPAAPGRENGGLYFEDATSFRIRCFGWTPVTETDADVIAGANNIVVQDENGSPEVIGFARVTSIGSGVYEVSRLLRGRRGTAANAQAWPVDTLFCFAPDFLGPGYAFSDGEVRTTLQRSRTQNNAENHWKVETARSLLASVDPFRQDVTFGTMQPFAASAPEVIWRDDGSCFIAWRRVTRNIFRGLFQQSGVRDAPWYPPLSPNDSNNWDLEILDPTGATVVRTKNLTGFDTRDFPVVNTPARLSVAGLNASGFIAATYSAAEVLADGYAPGDSIKCRIYQLSRDSTVGRGKVLELNL